MGLFSKREDIAANSSDRLVSDFILKSEGLQRILEKETEYFREMKMKQAEMLIETKLALIEELEVIKSGLISNPSVLEALADNEKNKVRAANANLMKAAEANYHETVKAKEVNKIIMEAIAEAVCHSKQIDGAYGEKGAAYKTSEAASPIAISENA